MKLEFICLETFNQTQKIWFFYERNVRKWAKWAFIGIEPCLVMVSIVLDQHYSLFCLHDVFWYQIFPKVPSGFEVW